MSRAVHYNRVSLYYLNGSWVLSKVFVKDKKHTFSSSMLVWFESVLKCFTILYTGVPVSVLRIPRSTSVSVLSKVRIPGPQSQISRGLGIRTFFCFCTDTGTHSGPRYLYFLIVYRYRDPLEFGFVGTEYICLWLQSKISTCILILVVPVSVL